MHILWERSGQAAHCDNWWYPDASVTVYLSLYMSVCLPFCLSSRMSAFSSHLIPFRRTTKFAHH